MEILPSLALTLALLAALGFLLARSAAAALSSTRATLRDLLSRAGRRRPGERREGVPPRSSPRPAAVKLSPEHEARLEVELGPEKVRTTRQSLTTAAVLFALFGILDVWAIPTALHQVWAIRAAAVAGLGAVLAATWRPWFARRYHPVTSVVYVSLGVAIAGMVALASPGDLARLTYYTGLILVVMALYTWTYLAPSRAAAIGTSLVVLYVLVALRVNRVDLVAERSVIAANLFFLVSANVIGFVAASCRDRFVRENYTLRHSLKLELDAKEEARQRSEFLAAHDPLTGLPNREGFRRELDRMIAEAYGSDRAVGVLYVDLDGFKPVNDSRGHGAGDDVLQVVARRLRGCVRAGDAVGRLGGDEFVIGVALPGGGLDAADHVAAKVLSSLSEPIDLAGDAVSIGASVGIAFYPFHGSTAAAVLDSADRKMYEAKRAGRRCARRATMPPMPALVSRTPRRPFPAGLARLGGRS